MSRSCLPTRGGNSTRLYYSCTSGQRRTRPCDMPRVGQGGLLARCTPRLLIGGVRQVRMGYTIEDIPIPTADASRRFKDRHECTNKSRSTIRPRPNKLPMHWPWRTHKNPPTIWARPKKTCHRFGPGPKKPANELAPAKKKPPTIWPWPKKTRQRFGPGQKKTANDLALAKKNPPLALAQKNPPTIWPRPLPNKTRHRFGPGPTKTRQRFGPGQAPSNDWAPANQQCQRIGPAKATPSIWPRPATCERFGPGQQSASDLATIWPRPSNNCQLGETKPSKVWALV